MKLPVSLLSRQDLAELFEKSSLKVQHFFPRKVPHLFSQDIKKSENENQKRDQNEKSVEKP